MFDTHAHNQPHTITLYKSVGDISMNLVKPKQLALLRTLFLLLSEGPTRFTLRWMYSGTNVDTLLYNKCRCDEKERIRIPSSAMSFGM